MTLANPLILNVDDTEPLRYVKTRTLRHAGFRVEEEGTAAGALAFVAAHRPDLVLLDVSLPDGNGLEVCRRIKRDWPDVMVLQVSATFVGSSDRVRGLEGGADAYMTQPAEPEELIASVRALLRLRSAERSSQANEAKFRALVEASAQIVWTADASGGLSEGQAGWCAFTGQSDAECRGAGWLAALHPDDRAAVEAGWAAAVAEGAFFEMEYRLRHHAGEWRWTLARGTPLHAVQADGSRGAPTGWVGMSTDIDIRKRAEAALEAHRHGLEQLVEERTAELLRASDERRRAEESARQNEKLAALGQLTGGVAHDFNNLLQVVSSGVSLLRSTELTPEQRGAVLDGMIRSTDNARELTARLLAFGRRQALRPEAFSLAGRLEAMEASLRVALGPAVRPEIRLPEDLGLAYVDPNQFQVALINLATNARDAMPEGGAVEIEAWNASAMGLDGKPEELVCLRLRDHGEGMPPAVLARVFEPFFTTKEMGHGTGLGLAQVHGFATQSKGHVAIESTPGEGTSVTLTMPRARQGSTGLAGGAVIDALQSSAGRHVLVVDDNEDAGAFAAALLRELGYAARQVTRAEAALAEIEAGAPTDAIFSDIVMPGNMDGIALAEAVRDHRPGIAVVLTTGYSDRLPEAHRLAAVEVLQKPYRLDELAAALGRALAGPRTATE